jgi:hypothetical protein
MHLPGVFAPLQGSKIHEKALRGPSRLGCAKAVTRNDSIPGPLFVFKKTE